MRFAFGAVAFLSSVAWLWAVRLWVIAALNDWQVMVYFDALERDYGWPVHEAWFEGVFFVVMSIACIFMGIATWRYDAISSIRIPVDTQAFPLPALVYGKSGRPGANGPELHLPDCPCAFHPFPAPHWHPCSHKHMKLRRELSYAL